MEFLFLIKFLISSSLTLPPRPDPCSSLTLMPNSLANLSVFGLAPVEFEKVFSLMIVCLFAVMFCSTWFSFSIIFSSDFLETSTWSEPESISRIVSPSETLSPILTLILIIFPEKVDGTSTLDLSLSSVITGSPLLILSPFLTRTSMISTSLKSPILELW